MFLEKIILKSKRAQSQVITTILIILLVLAAVVILWQVVQMTINKGGKDVTDQSKCMGVDLSITNPTGTNFIVTRKTGGGTFGAASVVVIRDGVRDTTVSPTYSGFEQPLGTAAFTLATGTTNVEAAYVGDGVTCPLTAKWP